MPKKFKIETSAFLILEARNRKEAIRLFKNLKKDLYQLAKKYNLSIGEEVKSVVRLP